MPMPPIPPVGVAGAGPVGGPEWSVGGLGGAGQVGDLTGAQGVQGPGGAGFGHLLEGLQKTQTDAAQSSQALATGTAQDASSVVMDLERARLSMQLAAQIRNKATEAMQDVMRTQV